MATDTKLVACKLTDTKASTIGLKTFSSKAVRRFWSKMTDAPVVKLTANSKNIF